MGKFQNTKENKKQTKKYIQLGIGSAIVLLLAVMPMLASNNEAANGSVASVLSATVENMDIDTQIIGGGQLSSEASLNVRIPENVKLTQYLVGNGDVVSEGDPIAKVDKVSVMTAITEVQDTLDYLADEIADASDDTASETVKALAGGTVKVIYAKEGESVQDVMLDHGALAILSLDDTMAVKIERESTLDVGDTVCVTLSDGTEVDGRVKTNLEGVLTITIDDDDYSVGAKVTVTTEDGDRLGTGELYIFSPWSATAYSGIVEDILVDENDSVYIGQTMFSLEDTGNTAQFQRLIDQRQEYEELMQDLFTMYRTETITAPCDGIVTGVDENGTYLLADNGEGWFASLLSFFGKKDNEGFVAYAAKVTEVTEGGMTLMMNPNVSYIEDVTAVSAVAADISAMTEIWNYSGDTTIYTQDTYGLLHNAGAAKVGDVLLAVGDEERVFWFVVLKGNNESAQTVQTENKQKGIFAFLLSDVDTAADTCTGNDDCAASTDNDGGPTVIVNQDAVFLTAGDEEAVDNEAEDDEAVDDETAGDEAVDDEAGNDEAADDEGNGGSDQQTATVSIITTALNPGVVGQSYNSPLQASDGTNILAGTWAAQGLPAGLTINADNGIISGTPEKAGSFTVTVSFTFNDTPVVKEYTLTIVEASASTETYRGYVAQVTEVSNGAMKVKQTAYTYTITDLNNLPIVSIDTNALTEEIAYVSSLVTETDIAVNDYLLLVVDQNGELKHFVKQTAPSEGGQSGTASGASGDAQGGGTAGGGTSSGGGSAAGGGTTQAQTFETYSLTKLTVASVTSQEHMTVSITIDELDITKIYVGQSAMVSVDALGGEQFEAEVTEISNSGENNGGNSKFTVELTLAKSGEMLPGMYSSAFITLETSTNVPCVPVAALDKDGVDSILYTSYDAQSGTLGDPVTVTIGSSDGENVEIVDGFTAGQICYYEYYDTYVGSDTPQQQGGFSLDRMLGGR